MILDEVLSKINGLKRDDLIPYISENLEIIVNDLNEISDLISFDINNMYSIFEKYIVLCVGADGTIDDDEYDFYQVLMAYLDAKPSSKEDISLIAGSLYNNMSTVTEIISTIISLYKFLDDKYAYRKAILSLTGAILQFNGTMEQQEIDFLNYVNQIINETCGPETSGGFTKPTTPISNKGFNSNSLDNVESELSSYSDSITYDDLYIKDFGCCYKKNYSNYSVSVGAIIVNPNENSIALDVNVKVLFKDANGRIIDSYTSHVYFIDANTEFNFGLEYDLDNIPSSVEVLVDCDNFDVQPSIGSLASDFVFSNYRLGRDSYGDSEFSATIQNPYNKTLDVDIYSVFLDKDGKITGGLDSHAYDLFKNSQDTFKREFDSGVRGERVQSSVAFYINDLI